MSSSGTETFSTSIFASIFVGSSLSLSTKLMMLLEGLSGREKATMMLDKAYPTNYLSLGHPG